MEGAGEGEASGIKSYRALMSSAQQVSYRRLERDMVEAIGGEGGGRAPAAFSQPVFNMLK